MRIAAVSAFKPLRDNHGGPTGLPYQLLTNLPDSCEVDLYCFAWPTAPEVDKKALSHVKVTEIAMPSGLARRFYYRRARLRGFPSGVGQFPENSRVIKMINESQPDLVWLFPYWLIDWLPGIRCRNIVTTGPDSAALHSERVIRYGNWRGFAELTSEYQQLNKNIALEKKWGRTDAHVHMVGKSDVSHYVSLTANPSQCYYTPLSHLDYVPLRKELDEGSGKIRVVITGGGQTVYVGNELLKLAAALQGSAANLADQIEFLLVGPHYSLFSQIVREAGYSVEENTWADDYSDMIASAQIQIFPIAVGTGTKYKVLNGLATGLLGIGTEFAFENIAVSPGEDCLLYRYPEQITEYLEVVLQNRLLYAEVARKGAEKVRQHHSPAVTSSLFWELALSTRTSG